MKVGLLGVENWYVTLKAKKFTICWQIPLTSFLDLVEKHGHTVVVRNYAKNKFIQIRHVLELRLQSEKDKSSKQEKPSRKPSHPMSLFNASQLSFPRRRSLQPIVIPADANMSAPRLDVPELKEETQSANQSPSLMFCSPEQIQLTPTIAKLSDMDKLDADMASTRAHSLTETEADPAGEHGLRAQVATAPTGSIQVSLEAFVDPESQPHNGEWVSELRLRDDG